MQEVLEKYQSVLEENVTEWFKVGKKTDFPENSGACIKYKTKQIAVSNLDGFIFLFILKSQYTHFLQ